MALGQLATLRKNKHIQWAVVLVALVLICGIALISDVISDSNKGAPLEANSTSTTHAISVSPASGELKPGDSLSVTLQEDSGSDAVNTVQVKLDYDPEQLQFVSIAESGAFSLNAATDTSTPGLIRLARGTDATAVSGQNAVATINFKVISTGGGTTKLTVDNDGSLLVRASDSKNILQTVTGASFTLRD